MASRTSSRRKRRTASRSPNDATTLLKADHARVKAMFQRFEKARREDQKAKLASTICSDRLFDAEVKVLGEYVSHHVEKEEGEMFPELRLTDLDPEALGREIRQRRKELQLRRASGATRRTSPSADAASATA
ncbi:MAG TPA: hemerythrin domain-containing protein [Steroidobacteraceae bacterium]|nr:hemerythrin domain-containing protein [Steroidobacteraceae bacterium]